MTSKLNLASFLQKRADRLSERLADFLEDSAVERQAVRLLDLLIETAIRVFAVVFIISVVLTIGPTIESRFAGVLINWSASNFEASHKKWEFDVYAVKPWYRHNCLYIRDQIIDARALVKDGDTTDTVPGKLTFAAQGHLIAVPNSDSREYFGHWAFESEQEVPAGSIIYGSIKHSCHFLWVSTTVFGPFEIVLGEQK